MSTKGSCPYCTTLIEQPDAMIAKRMAWCPKCDKMIPWTDLQHEDVHVDVDKGDEILVGKWKNKRIKVKSFGKDDHGMPTINGRVATTFRKAPKNEMSGEPVVKAWLKRNKSIFDKAELLRQAQSRFDISAEQAMKYFSEIDEYTAIIESWIDEAQLVRVDVWQGVEKKKFKLDPQEEDSLEKFLISVHKELPAALQKKQVGRFSKLGMIADIAKWYDEKGYITEKQLAILKKNVFDKMTDPAYIRKHLSDLVEKQEDKMRCKKCGKLYPETDTYFVMPGDEDYSEDLEGYCYDCANKVVDDSWEGRGAYRRRRRY